MKRDEILSRASRILSDADRANYFDAGYVGASSVVEKGWLDDLREVTAEFVEISRTAPAGDKRFDFEPEHTADAPRLRRLNHVLDHHETYWKFASTGPFADIAEDLLGPDFKFHHAKLNFKWSGGGEEVKWHQDIQFWPHTNYDVLTIGVYLEDVDDTMAPMGVIPGSHQGPLYNLYDDNDEWTGYISEEDIGSVAVETAAYLGGPAGSITVHNCRSIHGSPPNQSEHCRPLFLCAYSAADAVPLTDLVVDQKYSEATIRGTPQRWPRFDARPCPLPPPWRRMGGYKSIFAHQQAEPD